MALLLGILLALTSLSSVTAIPLDDFYPFGLAAGDTALLSTDDESSEPITLNREFPFYGRRQDVVVVSHLKGNCNGKISFLLFAFLSSPRSISKCGKISKLLVKYPLCCGQLNSDFLCGRGLFMTNTLGNGSYCIVWVLVSWKVN